MKALAAVLDKKGGNAVQKVGVMLNLLGRNHADAFCIATPDSTFVDASLERLPTKELKASTASGKVFLKVLATDTPQLTNFRKSSLVFDGRIYHPPATVSEAAFMEKLRADGAVAAAEALVRKFDGCFAFTVTEDKKLIVGRDSLGLYPLYYGENRDFFAVASECKALWKIGITETKSFPPGHVAIADRKGFKVKHVKTPKSLVHPLSMEKAVEKLQRLLSLSVVKRTAGLDEVAVAFSGGLDSSLIAFLVEKAGVEVNLIHVSLENQRETVQAEETARLLGLPLHKGIYSEGDVKKVLPKVLWCIEASDPLKASIGIPVYWAAEKAAELGFKVLLAGQGADELFGGYRRYLTLYSRLGGNFAQEAIINDILKLHESNLERDVKICSFHGVELRLPFVSYPLVKFALSLPLNLKIASTNDMLRKTVLRKTAEKLGLPKQIAYKPKKAVQYATGVNKTLKRLAEQENLPLKQYLQKVFRIVSKLLEE
ncbi:MAG: asparagine synthase-related protein [Candidatus Bathyarchaeota archaeon]|nr:asparagine synthase-related protein [Candidatus Bathyarchaeota archaeon]MDW8040685.1 asparagine synthase-related protein [Nitrososphaerota archaeon]